MRTLLWPAFTDGALASNHQSFDEPFADPEQIRDVRQPRAAWNLGQRVGLGGLWSLLPLFVGWGALAWHVRRARRNCA